MDFSDNAIRYFGEVVTASNAGNLDRRTDKYLYLACFCIYQRSIFEDWMVLTFLNVCKSAINKAARKEKERLFQNRKQHDRAFSQVIHIAQNSQELIKTLKTLTWAVISPVEKEKQFQKLLPRQPIQEQNIQPDNLEQIIDEFQVPGKDNYYIYLEEESQSLQQRANPIIKELTFNPLGPDKKLVDAVEHFKDRQGVITKTAPTGFLSEEDKMVLFDQQNKFRGSLYKILLFQSTTDAIRRGSLNLKYSFDYKAMDDYLIPKHLWDKDCDRFLDKANLTHLKDFQNRIKDFKKMVSFHFKQTNEHILKGENKHFRKRKNDKYHVVAPKVEKEEIFISIFPDQASISMGEVLSTIDTATDFLNGFTHLHPTHRKKRPGKSVFFAGITAYGCNLGIPAMARAASKIQANQLENTVNWFFTVENINRANDTITNFIDKIPLADLYRKNKEELRTSSDGQKIKTISEDTIFASYSTKYFDKGKGVVSYSFVDERCIPFYSVIIDPFLREAPFVLDGLLHNDVIKSNIHVTDTHGYTEAVFGLMDLLGFGFSPNIAKMLDQHIYTFKEYSIAEYNQKGYLVLPKGYFKEQQIEEGWDEMLRLATSLKLKYCKASQIFGRFNTFAKQHPLYIRDNCLFRKEINIYDKMSAQIKYKNNALVNYSLTTYSPFEGWRIAFNGTKGRIEATLDIPYMEKEQLNQEELHALEINQKNEGEIDYEPIIVHNLWEDHETVKVPYSRAGHGGGDEKLQNKIFRTPDAKDPFDRAAGIRDGAMSILIGIAARNSIESGRPVRIAELTDLEPRLVRL